MHRAHAGAYLDLVARSRVAMLALRVGWLMLKVELSEEAEPLFRRTHTLLQSLFGRGSVYGNAATPGLVRCLRLRGHAA